MSKEKHPWNQGYYRCDSCHLDHKVCSAQVYCQACEEKLCTNCVERHRERKATSCHTFVLIKDLITTDILICEKCRKTNKLSKCTRICLSCEVCVCSKCQCSYNVLPMSLGHHDFRPTFESHINFRNLIPFCDICKCNSGPIIAASYFCIQCDENLCNGCTNKHSIRKATKSHSLTRVSLPEYEEKKHGNVEDRYLKINVTVNVCSFCRVTLCEHCTEEHKQKKSPTGHKIRPAIDKYSTCDQCEITWNMYKTHDRQVRNVEEHLKQDRPGKPVASKVHADSIALAWERPSRFTDGNYYHIMYKEIDGDKNWNNFPDKSFTESIVVNGLRSNTAFVFRVRAIYKDGDGPPSVYSDTVITLESPACRYTEHSNLLNGGHPSPFVFAVPMRETERKAKMPFLDRGINMCEIGTRPQLYCKSKTILLVGAPGAGKTTLVDAMINYVLGVSWDDPYRVTMIQSKEEFMKKARSHTEKRTVYTIHPEKGGRLQYTLHIIDEPNFRRGGAFNALESMLNPLPKINVVCFVIQASDARLTAQQIGMLNDCQRLFASDTEKKNISTLVTFADGNTPPVLSALKESGLHFGEIFTFNNSSLFANKIISNMALSRVFWDMGFKSFKTFFDHIENIATTCYSKSDHEQKLLEAVMRATRVQIVRTLSTACTLKQNIYDIKEHPSLKGSYGYKIVPETFPIIEELPNDTHAINCISCQFACQVSSTYKECDETLDVIREIERCFVCPRSCPVGNHYISKFKCENVKIKTRYEEISEQDNDTAAKDIGYKLTSDLSKVMADLYNIIRSLITCDKRLKIINDLPDSCVITTNKYIDGMIEDEIHEGKEGFLMRVYLLRHLRI